MLLVSAMNARIPDTLERPVFPISLLGRLIYFMSVVLLSLSLLVGHEQHSKSQLDPMSAKLRLMHFLRVARYL